MADSFTASKFLDTLHSTTGLTNFKQIGEKHCILPLEWKFLGQPANAIGCYDLDQLAKGILSIRVYRENVQSPLPTFEAWNESFATEFRGALAPFSSVAYVDLSQTHEQTQAIYHKTNDGVAKIVTVFVLAARHALGWDSTVTIIVEPTKPGQRKLAEKHLLTCPTFVNKKIYGSMDFQNMNRIRAAVNTNERNIKRMYRRSDLGFEYYSTVKPFEPETIELMNKEIETVVSQFETFKERTKTYKRATLASIPDIGDENAQWYAESKAKELARDKLASYTRLLVYSEMTGEDLDSGQSIISMVKFGNPFLHSQVLEWAQIPSTMSKDWPWEVITVYLERILDRPHLYSFKNEKFKLVLQHLPKLKVGFLLSNIANFSRCDVKLHSYKPANQLLIQHKDDVEGTMLAAKGARADHLDEEIALWFKSVWHILRSLAGDDLNAQLQLLLPCETLFDTATMNKFQDNFLRGTTPLPRYLMNQVQVWIKVGKELSKADGARDHCNRFLAFWRKYGLSEFRGIQQMGNILLNIWKFIEKTREIEREQSAFNPLPQEISSCFVVAIKQSHRTEPEYLATCKNDTWTIPHVEPTDSNGNVPVSVSKTYNVQLGSANERVTWNGNMVVIFRDPIKNIDDLSQFTNEYAKFLNNRIVFDPVLNPGNIDKNLIPLLEGTLPYLFLCGIDMVELRPSEGGTSKKVGFQTFANQYKPATEDNFSVEDNPFDLIGFEKWVFPASPSTDKDVMTSIRANSTIMKDIDRAFYNFLGRFCLEYANGKIEVTATFKTKILTWHSKRLRDLVKHVAASFKSLQLYEKSGALKVFDAIKDWASLTLETTPAPHTPQAPSASPVGETMHTPRTPQGLVRRQSEEMNFALRYADIRNLWLDGDQDGKLDAWTKYQLMKKDTKSLKRHFTEDAWEDTMKQYHPVSYSAVGANEPSELLDKSLQLFFCSKGVELKSFFTQYNRSHDQVYKKQTVEEQQIQMERHPKRGFWRRPKKSNGKEAEGEKTGKWHTEPATKFSHSTTYWNFMYPISLLRQDEPHEINFKAPIQETLPQKQDSVLGTDESGLQTFATLEFDDVDTCKADGTLKPIVFIKLKVDSDKQIMETMMGEPQGDSPAENKWIHIPVETTQDNNRYVLTSMAVFEGRGHWTAIVRRDDESYVYCNDCSEPRSIEDQYPGSSEIIKNGTTFLTIPLTEWDSPRFLVYELKTYWPKASASNYPTQLVNHNQTCWFNASCYLLFSLKSIWRPSPANDNAQQAKTVATNLVKGARICVSSEARRTKHRNLVGIAYQDLSRAVNILIIQDECALATLQIPQTELPALSADDPVMLFAEQSVALLEDEHIKDRLYYHATVIVVYEKKWCYYDPEGFKLTKNDVNRHVVQAVTAMLKEAYPAHEIKYDVESESEPPYSLGTQRMLTHTNEYCVLFALIFIKQFVDSGTEGLGDMEKKLISLSEKAKEASQVSFFMDAAAETKKTNIEEYLTALVQLREDVIGGNTPKKQITEVAGKIQSFGPDYFKEIFRSIDEAAFQNKYISGGGRALQHMEDFLIHSGNLRSKNVVLCPKNSGPSLNVFEDLVDQKISPAHGFRQGKPIKAIRGCSDGDYGPLITLHTNLKALIVDAPIKWLGSTIKGPSNWLGRFSSNVLTPIQKRLGFDE